MLSVTFVHLTQKNEHKRTFKIPATAIMRIILSIVGFTLMLSCNKARVTMCLQNTSDYDFKEIVVSIGDTIKVFRELKRGETTSTFKTNKTYRYCYSYITLSNNDTVICSPIDFVGEKLHRRGKFKMQFSVIEFQQPSIYYVKTKLKRQW